MCRNYFLYGALLVHVSTFGMTIGSDSAVTLFNTQVMANNGDRIAGFAALNAGFALASSSVNATFDSFFSVVGNIQLNAGTLSLNQDLIFYNVSSLISLGNIIANKHDVHLSQLMNIIPSGSVTPGCAVTSVTSNTRGAAVLTVNWSYDSNYLAIGTNTHTGDGLVVFNFNGTTLTQAAELNFTANVNTLAWHPTRYWLAIGLSNGVLYTYSFTPPSTLTQLNTVTIGGSIEIVVWHPSGNYVAIGTSQSTEFLAVYPVNGLGIFGTPVIVNTAGNQVNGVDFNAAGTYLVEGDAANALRVYAFTTSPSPALTLSASISTGQVLSVAWNKTSSNSNIIAVALNNGGPAIFSFTPGTLSLVYTGPVIQAVFSVAWCPTSQCLAAGIHNGGAGTGIGALTFLFANSALTQVTAINTGSSNADGVAWSPSGIYLALAEDLATLVRIYSDGSGLNSNQVVFSDINLFIHGDVTLNSMIITFSGTNNRLNGLGNTLFLGQNSALRVQTQANLLLQNICIEGIQAGSIVPCDFTSTFSFQDVVWIMENNYSFTQGRFDVLRGFNLEGRGTSFIYTSNQVSRILANGNMLIDSGVTFSYAPSNNSNSLLQLTNINSTLSLNSGTIVTSSAGLKLTTGLLSIDGLSYLINGGTNQAQGIIWGDGVNSANNLQLEWQPAATLQLLTGFLVDNNV